MGFIDDPISWANMTCSHAFPFKFLLFPISSFHFLPNSIRFLSFTFLSFYFFKFLSISRHFISNDQGGPVGVSLLGVHYIALQCFTWFLHGLYLNATHNHGKKNVYKAFCRSRMSYWILNGFLRTCRSKQAPLSTGQRRTAPRHPKRWNALEAEQGFRKTVPSIFRCQGTPKSTICESGSLHQKLTKEKKGHLQLIRFIINCDKSIYLAHMHTNIRYLLCKPIDTNIQS